MQLKSRVKALVIKYGNLRAAGIALDIDHAYLHRLLKGTKSNPSNEVLKKLNLQKVITYKYNDGFYRSTRAG